MNVRVFGRLVFVVAVALGAAALSLPVVGYPERLELDTDAAQRAREAGL